MSKIINFSQSKTEKKQKKFYSMHHISMPLEISWIITRRLTIWNCAVRIESVVYVFSASFICRKTKMWKFHTRCILIGICIAFSTAWRLGKSQKSSKFDASKWQPYKSSLNLFDWRYKTIYNCNGTILMIVCGCLFLILPHL